MPCIGLLACLPMTKNNMWKLPLRLIFALVSLGMLILNFGARLSDGARSAASTSDDSGKGGGSGSDSYSEGDLLLDSMAYVVLASSMLLLAVMAVLFVIFVAFRGAQLQQRKERAANSPIELAENDLVADLAVFVEKRISTRVLRVRRVHFTALAHVALDRAVRAHAQSIESVQGSRALPGTVSPLPPPPSLPLRRRGAKKARKRALPSTGKTRNATSAGSRAPRPEKRGALTTTTRRRRRREWRTARWSPLRCSRKCADPPSSRLSRATANAPPSPLLSRSTAPQRRHGTPLKRATL